MSKDGFSCYAQPWLDAQIVPQTDRQLELRMQGDSLHPASVSRRCPLNLPASASQGHLRRRGRHSSLGKGTWSGRHQRLLEPQPSLRLPQVELRASHHFTGSQSPSQRVPQAAGDTDGALRAALWMPLSQLAVRRLGAPQVTTTLSEEKPSLPLRCRPLWPLCRLEGVT